MRVLRQLFCVIVLGFLWMPSVAAQQPPKSTIVGAGISNVQKRAQTEAEQYAASVAPDRDSSTFSALVRARFNQLVPYFISQNAQAKREIKNALTQFDKRAPALKNSPDKPTTVLLATPDPKTVSQIYLVDEDPRYRARRSTFPGRVYGGLPTIDYKNTIVLTGGTNMCTGIVVGPNAIVTALHCYCAKMTRAQVGVTYDPSAPGYKIVDGVPMRPCGTGKDADPAEVAILHTQEAFDPKIVDSTVFATSPIVDAATQVRAVGFGMTRAGTIGIKMMVDITLVSADCNSGFTGSSGAVTDSHYYGCYPTFEMVAADPDLHADTCHGDSGGPVFVETADGHEYLAGLTSRGVTTGQKPADQCGDGGIYERFPDQVLTWLRTQGVQVKTATIG